MEEAEIIREKTTAPIVPGLPVSRRTAFLLAALALLVCLLYAPVLKRLLLQWWDDPNYSHGFIVPVFVGLILWRERQRYLTTPVKSSPFGLAVIVGALGLLVVGTLGAELFTSRFSLLVLITGVVLFLAGWQWLRALAFPLAYLAFAIPWPEIIFNRVTFPLQMLASRMAAGFLESVGTPVLREGNILYLPNYPLEVAEACSGIRSLMSLFALAVAYMYFAETRWSLRVFIVALMVPIAVLSNGSRVVGAGLLAYHFGPEWAEGFFHLFSGWLVFLTALGLMLLAHSLAVRLLGRGEETENV